MVDKVESLTKVQKCDSDIVASDHMNHFITTRASVVAAPPIPPNWLELMFSSILSFTMFRIIDSKVFEAIRVR